MVLWYNLKQEHLLLRCRIVGCRFAVLAPEDPDLSFLGQNCCAAVLSNPCTRLTSSNNNNKELQNKLCVLNMVQKGNIPPLSALEELGKLVIAKTESIRQM